MLVGPVLLLALQLSGGEPTPVAAPADLELVYLANEGFLLRAGDDAVLIDAFVAEPYSIYAALSEEARTRLLAGAPPFDSLDVALASHVHGDHFQPALACAFLEALPDCLFVSSEDVITSLGKACSPAEDRVSSVLPDPGTSSHLRVGAIQVEFLRLSHGTGRFRNIQNLGHVVRLGNRSVLHLGDADMQPANFAPHGFADRSFDVALIPYWYFQHPDGQRFVGALRAEHVVAVHVPPTEVEATEALLAQHFPDVLLFRESLESWSVPARPPARPSSVPGTAPRGDRR